MEREMCFGLGENGGDEYRVCYSTLELGDIGVILKLSSYNVIRLPSNSFRFISLSNLEKADISDPGLSCGILNQTIENIFSLGNNDELVKCLSLVIMTLCSEMENSANLPLESPFSLNVTSYPSDFRRINNSFFMFSSNKNLGSFLWDNSDIIFASGNYSCIMQGCFDVFFSEWDEKGIHDFFDGNSSLEHLENLPNHNSRAFEGWHATTDFTINYNIFINFYSHNFWNACHIFKDFGNLDKMERKKWSWVLEREINENNFESNRSKKGNDNNYNESKYLNVLDKEKENKGPIYMTRMVKDSSPKEKEARE